MASSACCASAWSYKNVSLRLGSRTGVGSEAPVCFTRLCVSLASLPRPQPFALLGRGTNTLPDSAHHGGRAWWWVGRQAATQASRLCNAVHAGARLKWHARRTPCGCVAVFVHPRFFTPQQEKFHHGY